MVVLCIMQPAVVIAALRKDVDFIAPCILQLRDSPHSYLLSETNRYHKIPDVKTLEELADEFPIYKDINFDSINDWAWRHDFMIGIAEFPSRYDSEGKAYTDNYLRRQIAMLR